MPPNTKTGITEFKDLMLGLREEMRVGFANNDTKFAEIKAEIQGVEARTDTKFSEIKAEIRGLEAKTDIKFSEIKAEIQGSEAKIDIKLVEIKASIDVKAAELGGKIDVIDERTKLGFWGFVGRALIIAALILAISFSIKYFFFGTVKI
jgi:hypothetical protein